MQQAHEEVEESEELVSQVVSFKKVEELENFSVNKTDIQKLKLGGYNTIESIAHATMRKLIEVKGISEQKAVKIKEIIKANDLVHLGFQTATSRLESLKEMIYVSTGSRDLDTLLGGGIETGSLTEIFGEFRTGKTQICHTLCVNVQKPLDQGGAEGKAIYIDTEGTFRPQKLTAIAERYGMNPEEVLDNVICARAHNR